MQRLANTAAQDLGVLLRERDPTVLQLLKVGWLVDCFTGRQLLLLWLFGWRFCLFLLVAAVAVWGHAGGPAPRGLFR